MNQDLLLVRVFVVSALQFNIELMGDQLNMADGGSLGVSVKLNIWKSLDNRII